MSEKKKAYKEEVDTIMKRYVARLEQHTLEKKEY